MKSGRRFVTVFVTAPNTTTARRIAKVVLKRRLAACANLVPGIESHYWWKGQIDSSNEVLMIFKTLKVRLEALEKLILKEHPYDTPEIVALKLVEGNQTYLDWLSHSVS